MTEYGPVEISANEKVATELIKGAFLATIIVGGLYAFGRGLSGR